MKYNRKIKTFYNREMCPDSRNGYSNSPMKPKLLMEFMDKKGLKDKMLDVVSFVPFKPSEFYIAHTQEYVDAFFDGEEPLATSNSLHWSPSFADSVKYTNASLYKAIRYACCFPSTITFSPTSGFHHATPEGGSGFCTFSGQVIASLKIYKEMDYVGAYIDLDGHYGNSIEDTAEIFPEVNQAIAMNINPVGAHEAYLKDLELKLEALYPLLVTEQVNYVVFAHGADSHQDDQMGRQCTTKEWLQASKMVYGMIKKASKELGWHIPLTISLFGGYRDDDYNSVLSLHTADLVIASNMLTGTRIKYKARVKRRKQPPTFGTSNYISMVGETNATNVRQTTRSNSNFWNWLAGSRS